MEINDLKIKYDHLKNDIHRNKVYLNIYALLRLLLCCMVVIGLLVGYFYQLSFMYLVSIGSVISFFVIIYFHEKLKKNQVYLIYQADVYHSHLQRQKGKWDEFEDDGHEFIEEDIHLATDLDLFGHHSLYQMINVCFTSLGKRKLAKHLCYQLYNEEQLKLKQEAIKELSINPDFVYEIETYGRYSQDVILPQYSVFKIPSLIIPLFLSVLTCLSFLLMISNIALPYSMVVFEVCLIIQLILTFIKFFKHQQLFDPIFNLQKSLSHYKDLCEALINRSFNSSYIINQQAVLKDTDALLALEQLSHLSDFIHYRHNILVFLLFNIFFSYDSFCAYALMKWHNQYDQYLNQWLDCIADLEVCMSFSVLKIDGFDVTMPTIASNQALNVKNIRHPLIDQERVVGNDWVLGKQVNVITGSNMSGKTTFMRAIALNLCLAYGGGFVFCDACTCSLMHIFTSMRVKDNVEEGISTFYGELLRIKEMLEASKNNIDMICFIDEIFKGTNSLDRLAGAKATIEQLDLPHCVTLMTTHDFELCSLDHIDNYHFDESYNDNHICFSYKIHEGPCHSTNGLFLLKQLGIVEE